MIIVNLDVMLAKRKMSLTELSERVGITMSNLSILKKGKAKAIRFSTLESICRVLDCQPADILEYKSTFIFICSDTRLCIVETVCFSILIRQRYWFYYGQVSTLKIAQL